MIKLPSRSLSSVVRELQRASVEARDSGDLLSAEAFERQLKQLERDLALACQATNRLTFESENVDINRVKSLWSALLPVATHTADAACIIDCGERGTVTFVGGAILFSGRIAMEPIAALVLAEHAIEHHNGRGLAFGSREFLLHVAAANAATGAAIDGPTVNAENSDQVRITAQSWQPLLAQVRSRTPRHPSTSIRRVDEIARPIPA